MDIYLFHSKICFGLKLKACEVYQNKWISFIVLSLNLPWWPSCLDRGALNNVDAPGCGTSVVRGPTGHK